METLGCTDCEDFKGCLSCDYGGTKTFSDECVVDYCAGAGTQPIGTTTSQSPDVTDPDVTEPDVTEESSSEETDSPEPEPTGTQYTAEDIETEHAIALFSNDGIWGSVVVTRGQLVFFCFCFCFCFLFAEMCWSCWWHSQFLFLIFFDEMQEIFLYT